MRQKINLELAKAALSFPLRKFLKSDGSINRRQITLLHRDYQQDALNYIFISRAIDVHGVFFGYEESTFISMKQQVKIWCPDHEDYFMQTAKNHLEGFGCKHCANKLVTRKNAYGEFIVPAYLHKFMIDGDSIIWYNKSTKKTFQLENQYED